MDVEIRDGEKRGMSSSAAVGMGISLTATVLLISLGVIVSVGAGAAMPLVWASSWTAAIAIMELEVEKVFFLR